jgi:hypothetical protein
MAHLSKSEIIRSNPIGKGLDTFRDSFNSTRIDIPELSDAVHIGDKGETCRPNVVFVLMF